MAKIHESLVKVMRELGAIGKDAKNAEQNYNYRSAEAVYNRVQPLFAKHGIVSIPRVIEQQRAEGQSRRGGVLHYSILTVCYTFAAEDGSTVEVTVVGEGMDSGDKASNKAMTAAHKYAICQLLNIPYELSDPDANTPDWARKLEGLVTLRDVNGIKTEYAKVNSDLNKAELAAQFPRWVENVTQRAFDYLDFRQWTAGDLAKCREQLAYEASQQEGGGDAE